MPSRLCCVRINFGIHRANTRPTTRPRLPHQPNNFALLRRHRIAWVYCTVCIESHKVFMCCSTVAFKIYLTLLASNGPGHIVAHACAESLQDFDWKSSSPLWHEHDRVKIELLFSNGKFAKATSINTAVVQCSGGGGAGGTGAEYINQKQATALDIKGILSNSNLSSVLEAFKFLLGMDTIHARHVNALTMGYF